MRRAAGGLRSFAALAAMIFAAAHYLYFTHAMLSPSHPAPSALRHTVSEKTPSRLAAQDSSSGQRFWLSREFHPGDPRLVDVVGAGDVMMGSRDSGLNPDMRAGADIASLVGPELAGVFRHADIAFANLEGPLYDGDGVPSKICAHCYVFRSPTAYAQVLAQLGIRAVSLANNHSGDYGEAGRASTIAALRANGIGYCGLDRDGARVAELVLKNGAHVAIVSFAPNSGTLDINDFDAEAALVKALKATHAIVLVSFHGGGEGENFLHVSDSREYFDGEDRGNVLRFARTAIDAGADIVIGQGPHVPRALEIYRGHLIAYSLGNFWTYGDIDTSAIRGAGPVLEAWLMSDGTLAGFEIHSTEQRETGVPHLDPARDAEREMLALTRSDFPDTAALLETVPHTSGEERGSGGGPGS
jgi:hypothetical protein